MKISLIQMNVQWKNNDANYQKAKNLIEKAALQKPDVVVLPEMWNCGFFPKEELESFSEKNGDRICSVFSELAKNNKLSIVAGSVSNMIEKRIYNTSFVFDKSGQNIAQYNKIHLFSPMNENQYFHPGNKIVTFELDNVLCGIVICYDIRFLELIRNLALKGIQVLFVVAHWPEVRIEHWELINRVRAIENQFFVVAVNACGNAPGVKFGGHSLVVDPWGEILLKLSSDEEVQCVEIDLEILKKIRSSINVFNDRDKIIDKIL